MLLRAIHAGTAAARLHGRILYCTREIVVFRSDVSAKMALNQLGQRTDAEVEQPLIAKVLLDQAHLSPLPLAVQPVAWEFSHALRLYPAPDVVRHPRN